MVLGSAVRWLKSKQFENELTQKIPTAPTHPEIPDSSLLSKLGLSVYMVSHTGQVNPAVQSLLGGVDLLGLDIETAPLLKYVKDKSAGLDPRKSTIRLIQIYDGKDHVFVFDLLKLGDAHILGKEIWTRPMIAHNAMFELKHLLHCSISPEKLGCTLLADRVLNGNRIRLKKELGLSASAGLKDLAKELLSLDISKAEQISEWGLPELSTTQIEYAALDAVLPVRLFQKQYEMLKHSGLSRSYEILRDAQKATALMELSGIGFNVDQHKSLIEEWEHESTALKKAIHQALGQEINLNSGKQMGGWLSETLVSEDLKQWTKTTGGKLSTSTPTFKAKVQSHPIFPKLIEYRHVAKKISSFGNNLYKFIEGDRLYGSFSLGTTSTGRMASQRPNMQNMPRTGFRDLFIAAEGYVLIGLDYSQQELRVAALVTGDIELLRIYEEGGDVHTNTAAAILKIPKESVTKPQRQLAKAVIFGLLYGQGAKGLATYAKQQYAVEMTEAEAETHRKNLFKTYRGLRSWQQSTGNLVKVIGKIRTQCGRLRDFNHEQEGYRFTVALNHPIQGAAAEITLRAITRLIPLLSNECRLVNVIHDEILLEVIEPRIQEVAAQAIKAMEAAFLDVFPSAELYLKGLVEAKIGKNWGETK